MTKYSLEIKLEAVNAYLNGIESVRGIAERYNVNRSLLHRWIAKFQEHGLSGFLETYTNYSIEFKMDVLNYMNETGASTEEASAVFNIPSSSTVWNWRHLIETKGIDALKSKKKGRPSMKKETKKKQPLKGSEDA